MAVLIVGMVRPNFAADTAGPGFDSPEQAIVALYTAVNGGQKRRAGFDRPTHRAARFLGRYRPGQGGP